MVENNNPLKETSGISEEDRRKLIRASNTLKPGYPDYLGSLHSIMNSRNPTARNKIFDADTRYEKSKRGGGKKGGRWGPWKNEGRDLYIRRTRPMIERGFSNLVNRELTDAEIKSSET